MTRTDEQRAWVTDRRIRGYNDGLHAFREAERLWARKNEWRQGAGFVPLNAPYPPEKEDPFYREGWASAVRVYLSSTLSDAA